jgi:hypothetical protein
MALRSSTQIGLGRDDDRWSPGFIKAAATVFFGGEVVTQDTTDLTGKTLMPFNGIIGALSPFPLGLVYENTNAFTPGGVSGDSGAGAGFDSLDYARGGMYSVFHRPGNLIDVLNDFRDTTVVSRAQNGGGGGAANQGKSCPFAASLSYAIGDTLYSTDAGLLTNVVGTATVILGYVRAASGTGENQILSVEWAPSLV